MKIARTLLLLTTIALSAADAGEMSIEKQGPPLTPLDDRWRFSLAAPGWLAGIEGDVGVNGYISKIDIAPDAIIRHLDMAAMLRGEASKGRFGVTGEFIYLSLSDGIGTERAVKKIDLQVDQIIGDLGLRWRILEGERGFLDVIGGVRYVNLYQKLALQPNDERINAVAGDLATAGTALRVTLARELAVLAGKDPTLPIAPLGGGEAERLARAIGRVKGSTAERQAKIARLLRDALSRTVSRTDDWFDPYIGLRVRYNFTDRFYVTAKGEIGGFGVGSDFTWQAEAALGCQVTQSIFAEAGYRALSIDYEDSGLTYDVITHGAQVTLGITF